MNVRLGWSGEVRGSWTKMDVEVTDEDLDLLLAENGLDPNSVPLKSGEKFRLLYTMAEIFVQSHKMTRFPERFGTEDDRKEFANLMAARDGLLNTIKDRNDNKPPF